MSPEQPPSIDARMLLALCDDATFDVVAVAPETLRALVESHERHQQCLDLSIKEARVAGRVLAERDAAIAEVERLTRERDARIAETAPEEGS